MEVSTMANIKPISDLRNYNALLKDCTADEPVYLTKNGRGKYVILDVAEYDRLLAEIKLLNKIASAEIRIQNGESYLSFDELKSSLQG